MGPNKHFTDKYFETKHAFVEGALAEFRPKNVLDVGCNTGHFSALAARSGAAVVGIDQDPAVVGQVWREAREQGLNVLPLVVDLTRPSPAIGWRNLECPSFLERTRAAFDGVLMLAVIHHMLVSERIPLPQILELAAELTSDLLVIEFVPTDDPMFRRLSRGRDHLFTDLSVESFEAACRRHFEVVRSRRLEESPRSIYLLRKRVGR
jgi:SAM-dependent methyltransferase